MRTLCLGLIVTVLAAAATARGQATATLRPDADFATKVNVAPLRAMAVQHAQTVKTFDSFARQVLESITGHGSVDGADPVYTVLDIAYRPEAWSGRDLIKIRSVPLRKEFNRLPFLSDDEKARIISEGTVSLELATQPEVQQLFRDASAADVRRGQAVNQFNMAVEAMNQLCGSIVRGHDDFPPVALVPPAMGSTDGQWHRLIEVSALDREKAAVAAGLQQQLPTPVAGYTEANVQPVENAAAALLQAWRAQDPQVASDAAGTLAQAVVAVDPAAYPSSVKRQVEVAYNRLAKMTLPGAACYFVAFALFIAASRSGLASLRLWGIRVLGLGIAVHTVGIGVRWWLVGSIPIKNEFESVMFSAWFGVIVGTLLEIGAIQAAFRGLARVGGVRMTPGSPIRDLFGAAAGFVGFLSLIAIFTVPLVSDVSIGQEIGRSNGVLYSYWLYIHVTMVTASYALIGMGFLLSVWWLVKYYANYERVSRISQRQLEGEAQGFDVIYPGGGGAVAVSPLGTLMQLMFLRAPTPARLEQPARRATAVAVDPVVSSLAALDACNLVVLQLAFWALGLGIVFGAIWADMSWGRPWAWDPKETFALITWIVYLIVVHVRVTTDRKAWWTAVLSAGGFFVMLFNWVGVNFFLKGLHSYAG